MSKSTFSHDRAVSAITSFYELLARAHSDDCSELRYPPITGWPQINAHDFAYHEYNETVLKLLRHIPYFFDDDQLHIMNGTAPINYADEEYCEWVAEKSRNYHGEDKEYEPYRITKTGEEPLPSHVVALADLGEEQEWGFTILLDTRTGIVAWQGNAENPFPPYFGDGDIDLEGFTADPTMTDIPETQFWHLETFLRQCEQQFLVMNWMAVVEDFRRGLVEDIGEDRNPINPRHIMRQRVLVEAGWPGDGHGRGWNKNEAVRIMDEAWKSGLWKGL
jgi:hypothetical protein